MPSSPLMRSHWPRGMTNERFICSSCTKEHNNLLQCVQHVAKCVDPVQTIYLVCCGRRYGTSVLLSRHVSREHRGCLFNKYGGDLLKLDHTYSNTGMDSLYEFESKPYVVAKRTHQDVIEVAKPHWLLGKCPVGYDRGWVWTDV